MSPGPRRLVACVGCLIALASCQAMLVFEDPDRPRDAGLSLDGGTSDGGGVEPGAEAGADGTLDEAASDAPSPGDAGCGATDATAWFCDDFEDGHLDRASWSSVNEQGAGIAHVDADPEISGHTLKTEVLAGAPPETYARAAVVFNGSFSRLRATVRLRPPEATVIASSLVMTLSLENAAEEKCIHFLRLTWDLATSKYVVGWDEQRQGDSFAYAQQPVAIMLEPQKFATVTMDVELFGARKLALATTSGSFDGTTATTCAMTSDTATFGLGFFNAQGRPADMYVHFDDVSFEAW